MTARSDEASERDPLVSCTLQGGTLSVFEDRIEIDRSSASMHDDKSIQLADVRGVNYSGGLLTGHIQIEEVGIEPAEAGFLSHPVDENTLYFPRSERDCAGRARDVILERMDE